MTNFLRVLGFRGLVFRVFEGFGFRVLGVKGLGLRVWGLGFRVFLSKNSVRSRASSLYCNFHRLAHSLLLGGFG